MLGALSYIFNELESVHPSYLRMAIPDLAMASSIARKPQRGSRIVVICLVTGISALTIVNYKLSQAYLKGISTASHIDHCPNLPKQSPD